MLLPPKTACYYLWEKKGSIVIDMFLNPLLCLFKLIQIVMCGKKVQSLLITDLKLYHTKCQRIPDQQIETGLARC